MGNGIKNAFQRAVLSLLSLSLILPSAYAQQAGGVVGGLGKVSIFLFGYPQNIPVIIPFIRLSIFFIMIITTWLIVDRAVRTMGGDIGDAISWVIAVIFSFITLRFLPDASLAVIVFIIVSLTAGIFMWFLVAGITGRGRLEDDPWFLYGMGVAGIPAAGKVILREMGRQGLVVPSWINLTIDSAIVIGVILIFIWFFSTPEGERFKVFKGAPAAPPAGVPPTLPTGAPPTAALPAAGPAAVRGVHLQRARQRGLIP